MRIHELLSEARPENINQPTLDKLFAAYQNKDSQDDNYKSETSTNTSGTWNRIKYVHENYLTASSSVN